MKKILISAIVLISVISLSVIGECAPAAPKVLRLKFSCWTTPPSPPGKAVAKWIEMVEQRTKGKVKVDAMFAGTLLAGKNTIEGILQGVADVGMNVSSFRPERFPMMALLNYPHPYKHTMVPIKIAWDMYNKFNPAEFKGVKLISFSCNGMGENGCGFFGKFPVTGLADLKGKEIRATGTGVQALEKLGAAPVFSPVEEVYESLQKNIIKGVYTTFEIIRPFKFNEVIEYITPFPAPAAVMFTIVKNETFNSWPADVRKVIEGMKMEHSEWAGNYAHSEGQGGLTYSVEKGVKKTVIPPNERAKMIQLLKPLTDDWVKVNSAKGLPAKQWLDEFNKLLDKYNAQY
jgi:TRAP-type C4-dicarboxylate transport system substrate-binding protein